MTDVYERLFREFGPQKWWPGESPFEVLVGAVLVQNTAWRNVERAIENLREAGVMTPARLYALAESDLAELIRPAGYYQVKARRLRNLLRLVVERYDGSLSTMFQRDLSTLREELLSVSGIGPETADAILLYVGGLATFVVDTYTHRVLARHGWIGYEADYHQIQDHFTTALPPDAALYNEYHALLVRLGKDYCRKTAPKCTACPLFDLLPASGIVEPF
ncbi:MAG: endonuclease III domain-containing protein [Pirellulales bacterium]